MSVRGRRPNTNRDAGTVTKALITPLPGEVFAFRVTNANAAVRYFQLHNKVTAPVATDVSQQFHLLPAGSAAAPTVMLIGSNDLADEEAFTLGIGWAISTTALAFTDAATAADHTVNVRWRA